MKKQRVVTIILLLLIGCAAAVTAACTPKKLSTPQNLQISGHYLTWDKVDGAKCYLIGANYEEYVVEDNLFDIFSVSEPNIYQLEVQAIGDGKKYLNSYWSEKKRYNLKVTEGFKYNMLHDYDTFGVKGTYEVSLINNKDISGAIVLPSEYNNIPVTTVGRMDYLENVTDIYIPHSIVMISSEAFNNGQSLKNIRIPASVNNIGAGVFRSCTNLEKIEVDEGNEVYKSENNCIIRKSDNTLIAGCKNSVIPKYVETIGNRAFSGCSGLTSIEIPDGVETIGSHAFSDCSGLTSIEIPDGVETIEMGAFRDAGIKEIKLPDGIESIGHSAFCDTALKEITLPEGLKSIGEYAFANTAITKLRIPASVEEIGKVAFDNCVFDEITVAEGNASFKMDSNCLIRLADNTALYGENVEELIIPDYVKKIGTIDECFGGDKTLRVVIPESVKDIYGDFSKCVNVKSFIFAGEIINTWDHIFSNCTIYSVQSNVRAWDTELGGGWYDGNSCVTVFGCSVKYDGIYPYVYSVQRGKIRNPSNKSANPPERKGYTFGGWTTEEGGTTAQYTAAEIENVPQGTTIYAIWLQN